jgi:hypothetical protein
VTATAHEETIMLRAFDGPFWLGTVLVGLALAIVVATIASISIPVLGTGRLALLAVGGIGLAACMANGVNITDSMGKLDTGSPTWIFGAGLGILAFAIVLVGLVGVEPILRPVGQLLPGSVASGEGAEQRIAIVALGALIALKWVIGVAVTTLHVLKLT